MEIFRERAEKQQAAILARARRGLPQILLTCYYAAGIRLGPCRSHFPFWWLLWNRPET